MADLVTTQPKSSDSKNNLLFKWVEIVCGPGIAKFADSDNDLLKKILSCTISGSGSGPGDPPPPPPGDPVVDFIADVTSGLAPLTVNFTNLSVGDFTSYLWDFGDGDTSVEENPSHEYLTGGSYTVTLTGFQSGGGADIVETKVAYIIVGLASFLDVESDLGVVESSGDLVSWADQSGNNRNITATIAGAIVVAGQLNGFPAIRVTDVGESRSDILDVWSKSQMTVVAVLKPLSIDESHNYFTWNETAANISITPDDWMFSGATAIGGTPEVSPVLLVYVHNGASSYLEINGVVVATGNAFGLFSELVFIGNGRCDHFAVTLYDSILSAGNLAYAKSVKQTKYNL